MDDGGVERNKLKFKAVQEPMDGSELGLGGSPGRLCKDVWRAPVSASVRSEDDSGANFPRASGLRSGARVRSDGKAERWTRLARWLRAPVI